MLQLDDMSKSLVNNLIPGVRNAVRALIISDGSILLLRKDGYPKGERYALPGGAQDLGETLKQALNRECLEEIGTRVQINGLLHVADWFKERETEPPSTRHLVEFLFDCGVPEGYQPRSGHHPDKHQVEVLWKPLPELPDIRLLPQSLAEHLANYPRGNGEVYLGSLE